MERGSCVARAQEMTQYVYHGTLIILFRMMLEPVLFFADYQACAIQDLLNCPMPIQLNTSHTNMSPASFVLRMQCINLHRCCVIWNMAGTTLSSEHYLHIRRQFLLFFQRLVEVTNTWTKSLRRRRPKASWQHHCPICQGCKAEGECLWGKFGWNCLLRKYLFLG